MSCCKPSPTCNDKSKCNNNTDCNNSVIEGVKEYYSKTLSTSKDLKTNACCTSESMPSHIKAILKLCHDEVIEKYYGCGIVMPEELKGMKLLDLGSGSGRDCFLLSSLVSPSGHVTGVDMTPSQIEVATKHIEYHREKFGYEKANTDFKQGYIEDLAAIGLQDNSFDVIVSNCVVNLSPNKEAVLKEAYRVLKDGGEMYFSDVYANKRIPQHLKDSQMLWGECLSGAMYWNDFIHLCQKAGFTDPRLVKDSPITINNKEVSKLLEGYQFFSATYRLFKIQPNQNKENADSDSNNELEYDCEDYGQAVKYLGTIEHCKASFSLDNHHLFETGKMSLVCGNTFTMLKRSRFASHFEFYGDRSVHYGIFPQCGKNIPFASSNDNSSTSSSSSCC